MNGSQALGLAVTAGLILSFALGVTGAERQSLKNQIVGTWTLVDLEPAGVDSGPVRNSDAPKGVHVFGADGRFFALFAQPTPGAAEITGSVDAVPEDTLINDGSVAYFGRYTVNNVDRSVDLVIEASTVPSQLGQQHRRLITSISGAELKYATPAVLTGAEGSLVFRRAQ